MRADGVPLAVDFTFSAERMGEKGGAFSWRVFAGCHGIAYRSKSAWKGGASHKCNFKICRTGCLLSGCRSFFLFRGKWRGDHVFFVEMESG